MEIYIAADHAGYELKEELIIELARKGHEVHDLGADEYDEDDDYVDYVAPLARLIAEAERSRTAENEMTGEDVRGIIIGGSGQGEAIVANRFQGVRAVVFNGQYEPLDGREVPDEIALSRQHNDSNVLSLGARFLSSEDAIDAVDRWLETAFSGDERHVRRLAKIDAMGGIRESVDQHHDHGSHSGDITEL